MNTFDSSPDALVTVILLNWRRPFNVPAICDALRAQTVPTRIIVWTNESPVDARWRCDEVVYSSENLICWPRWFMAAQAATRYVMVIDDDLCPTHRESLSAVVDCADRHYEQNIIVGLEGVRLSPGEEYFPKHAGGLRRTDDNLPTDTSCHLRYIERDTPVDVVKGRLMLMKPSVLEDLPMRPPYSRWADDMVVSAHVARGRPHPHMLAPTPRSFFTDMSEVDGAMALSGSDAVRQEREACRQHYFAHI